MDDENFITENFQGETLNLLNRKAVTENKKAILDLVASGSFLGVQQHRLMFLDMIWLGENRESDDDLLYKMLCLAGHKLIEVSDWEKEEGVVDYNLEEFVGEISATVSSLLSNCIVYGWPISAEWFIGNIDAFGFDIHEYLDEAFSADNSVYGLVVTLLVSGSIPMLELMEEHDLVRDINFKIKVEGDFTIIDVILTTLILADYDLENISAEWWTICEDESTGVYKRRLEIEYNSERSRKNIFEAALCHRLNDTLDLMDWPDVKEEMIKLYTLSKVGEEKLHTSLILQSKAVRQILCLPVPLECRIVLAETRLLGGITRDRNTLDNLLRLAG